MVTRKTLSGRPKGSTLEKKRNEQQDISNAQYTILIRYLHEIELAKNSRLTKKRIFFNILDEEKKRLKLQPSFKFPYRTAISRIRRCSLKAQGGFCPLIHIEKKLIDLILCMSKIKRSFTVSEALQLINQLIEGTIVQEALIQWKLDHKIYHNDEKELGTVGRKWWTNFLKRNGHLIKSKSGKKYAFDRANFSTYLNFSDMYNHIGDILVYDSKVASKYEKPIWVNKDGKEVFNEDESFGCKVSIDIHRPDMCIVMDEVGCNLSQENDNVNGGQKYMCGNRQEPYQVISTKHHHFTCLGLTRLDGVALLCVVIISGKKTDALVESGVEWDQLNDIEDVDSIEDVDELQFFINNFGKDNLFPGGPTCRYKGVEVPAFVTFSDSGGISGEILTNIFRRLDDLHLYDTDRANGLIPFVLLDGHHSRFDVEFLCYINDDKHRWNVTLGVPYGTALWQVADSSEQNGKFKMLLGEAKKELLGKESMFFYKAYN